MFKSYVVVRSRMQYVHPNKFKLVWVLVLARLKVVVLRLPRLELLVLLVQVEASSSWVASSSKLQAIEGKDSSEAKSSDMSNEKTEAGESILDRLTRLLLLLVVGATRKASRASDAGVVDEMVKVDMVVGC